MLRKALIVRILRIATLTVMLGGVLASISQDAAKAAGTNVTVKGSASTICDMGTTTFGLSFTAANTGNPRISNLTFDTPPAVNLNSRSATAQTSKSYTFKCNSPSKITTITANPAVNSSNGTRDYTVQVCTTASCPGSVVAFASTSGNSSGTGNFTSGLNAGSSFTVRVTTVSNSNSFTGNFSTTFTIQ